MVKLTSENLTNIGRPMGTEYTTTNWDKYFKTVKKAKAYAEKDYREKIKWEKDGSGITSGDLSYVMYDIKPVKMED